VQNFFLILAAQAPEQFFFTRSRSGCAQKKPLPGMRFFLFARPGVRSVNFFYLAARALRAW
jgi:hypothetical protein